MEIYRPLTKVKVDDVNAIITSAEIFSQRIVYKVEWWNGKSLVQASIDESRITSEDYTDKRKIGFK